MAFREKKQPEKRDDTVKSEIAQRFKAQPFLFIGTVFILVIVIVAFVFVPAIVPNVQAGEDLVFGYYNKTPIKYVQGNYFNQILGRLNQNQQPSPDDPNYIINVAMMWRQAFEETVIYTGILDEMKQAGYKPPENVVDREVAELPDFQENGRFSAAKYRALSNNDRLAVWRQAQESIILGMYTSDVMSLRTASGETSFIGSMSSPRRNFDIAVFPASLYPDSEITSYAAANPDLFRVTRLSRITINSSEREARQVLESVKSGTVSFEDAAKTNSQDAYAEQSGDMGIKMAHELVYEISDEQARETVINLAKGALSDLVTVETGWAFFRAEDAVHPADINDPAQRGNIRSYVMANARGQVEDWLMAEAEKFSARVKTGGFDAAASAANITRRTLGFLPVNYGDTGFFGELTLGTSGIPELSGAGRNEFFWKAAFTTPLNTPSGPLVVGDNVIVLFPLEERAAEASEIESAELSSLYWMSAGMQETFGSYFVTNEKLDDRFQETFWKLWQ